MYFQRIRVGDDLPLGPTRPEIRDHIFRRDDSFGILGAQDFLELDVLRMRYSICNRKPIGSINRYCRWVSLGDEISQFIVDREVLITVVITGNRHPDFP